MADNTLTLTAAELREIGNRIKRDRLRPVNVNIDAEVDRARLYSALERLQHSCAKALAYRDRVGSLEFQLEKLDDFFREIRAEQPNDRPMA